MVLVLAVATLFLQYELWLGQGGLATVFQLTQRIHTQTSLNAVIIKENNTLAADIHDLKTGEQSIEARARDRLGMVKSDETYYQFIG